MKSNRKEAAFFANKIKSPIEPIDEDVVPEVPTA